MSSIISASTTSATALNLTADTSGQLEIKTGSTPTTAITVDTSQRAAFVAGTAALPAITTTGDTNTGMFFPAADTIAFAEGGAESIRLDSSGNVLVGTTTNTPGYKLYVKGGDGNQVILDNAGSTYTTMNYYNNGANKLSLFWDNSTPRYYVVPAAGGGVYLAAGATSWTASSDERVKDIIEPITNAIEKVSTLRAVIGKYKTDEEGTRRTFLIAQDVEAVLPEAVDTTNTNEYGLRYTDTIPLLVAAIKEQQTIINDLKARITALEGASL